MNAVEIEKTISQLAERPFDKDQFSYQVLEAFGNKSTTITRLKSGTPNKSDVPSGMLQYNNIHILVCNEGEASMAFEAFFGSGTVTCATYRECGDGRNV